MILFPWLHLAGFLTLSARGPSYTSESDVCRRQILTYKDSPRAERIIIFLMAADP